MGEISPRGCATGEVAGSNDNCTDASQNKMHQVYLTGRSQMEAGGMVVTSLRQLRCVSKPQVGLDTESPIGWKLEGIRRIPGVAVQYDEESIA